MIQKAMHFILFEVSYFTIFWIGVLYFLTLYGVLGFLFRKVCNYLFKHNILNKIIDKVPSPRQIKFEILHSLKSIFLFGFSGLAYIYFVRQNIVQVLPNNLFNFLMGLLLLNLWNEVHFFLVHRIMHISIFMRKVHYVHHKSKIPTTYSVFSFHWLEALLLSTVPLTITPFVPFCSIAVLLYPVTSILLNFSGHCNYRFGNGNGESWFLFATHHNQHHHKARNNYGFASNLLDKIQKILF